MEMRSGIGKVLGRLSRRAVILCALLVLSVAGGLLLTRVLPHSNVGVILFAAGVFLLLPLTIGEVQGGTADMLPNEEQPFVYGSADIEQNPFQLGVHTTSALDD